MTSESVRGSMLAGNRVLDLTDESGSFCTKILAYLGADVIRIEKPGGDPCRRIGPFYHDVPDPERSLHWFLHNLNKRSVTLDIATRDGQELFKRLVRTAHFVVECSPPGYMDGLRLGYKNLADVNSSIIVTSITPFGQAGPYRDWKYAPVVADALSGHLYTVGEVDRPPVTPSFPAVPLHSGSQAALGTILAHYYRGSTGRGQHIDVSVQEAAEVMTMPHVMAWRSSRLTTLRDAAGPRRPGMRRMDSDVFRCRDGYVFCYTTYWQDRGKVREWLASEGRAGDLYEDKWDAIIEGGGPITVTEREYVNTLFGPMALEHTMAELVEAGQKRLIQIAPVHTVKDIVENAHLAEREYFVPVEHPELDDTLKYPRPPFRFSEVGFEFRRAPHIGEHNEEIYLGELGLSRSDLVTLKQAGVI